MATALPSDLARARRTELSRQRLLVAAAVVTVLVAWASAFVGIRSANRSFQPGPIALIRLLMATVVLTPIAVHRRPTVPSRPALACIAVYGVLWFGLYNVVLNAAERHLDAGTASMLVNVAPLLVAVGAVTLLGERFSRRLVVGLLVAFSGVVVISTGAVAHRDDVTGVALGLCAALCYAGGMLSQKLVVRDVSALQATWLGTIVGVMVTLPFAPQTFDELGHARGPDILVTAYLGVFPTAIGFLLWAYALSRTAAGFLASTTLAVPAIVVLLSWLLLAQLPTIASLLGGAMCLTGVATTTGIRFRRRAPA